MAFLLTVQLKCAIIVTDVNRNLQEGQIWKISSIKWSCMIQKVFGVEALSQISLKTSSIISAVMDGSL